MSKSDWLASNDQGLGAGVYDGLSALVAAEAKYDFLWVSSFCLSACQGLPDVGLLQSQTVCDLIRLISSRVPLPVVVDLETGFGDLVKVHHLAGLVQAAGASAIVIEDNDSSKRSSLYDGYSRTLADPVEHANRVRACRLAVDAGSRSCKVIARTEALVAGYSVEEAYGRLEQYLDAGADGIFIQSRSSDGIDVIKLLELWDRRSPVLLSPTCYPKVPVELLFKSGASHIIHANQGLRAAHMALQRVFSAMRESSRIPDVATSLSTVAAIAELVGEPNVRLLENDIRAFSLVKLGPAPL